METRSLVDWLRTPKPSKFYGKYFVFQSEAGRVAKYDRIGRVWDDREGKRHEAHHFRYVYLNDAHTGLIESYELNVGLLWFENASLVFDTEEQVIKYLKDRAIVPAKAPISFWDKIFNKN